MTFLLKMGQNSLGDPIILYLPSCLLSLTSFNLRNKHKPPGILEFHQVSFTRLIYLVPGESSSNKGLALFS